MRRLSACLLPLLLATAPAAAQDAPAPPPPDAVPMASANFECSLSQQGPLGEIGAAQFVSPQGVAEFRLDSWSTSLAPGGIAIDASWDHPDPARYSLVWLSQSELDPRRSYRIRIQRDSSNDERALVLESPLARPDRDGRISVHTRWELLTAMLAGGGDPRILVVRDDGAIVRGDAIDPAVFARVLAAAIPLQPVLDAMIADYRNRCPYFAGGPIVPPEPVALPDQAPDE